MKMANAFAASGLEVELIALANRRWKLRQHELFDSYAVERTFRVILLPALPFRGNSEWLAMAAILRSRLFSPDIIYTRSPQTAALASLCVKSPCILERHAPFSTPIERRAGRAFLAKQSPPRIVAITHALRNQMVAELRWPPEHILVAPDGADEYNAPTKSLGSSASKERIRVGYLGHLYRGKGMEVIAELVRLAPWADFEIVGGMDTDISYWKERLATASNVNFRGFIHHADCPSALSSFDIALLPNQGQIFTGRSINVDIGKWTSPLKAFEYMSAGLPIIASNQANLREIFRDQENALLCDPEDVGEWARALSRLAHDKRLRIRLGEQALKDFLARYTWTKRAQRIVRWLKNESGPFHAT